MERLICLSSYKALRMCLLHCEILKTGSFATIILIAYIHYFLHSLLCDLVPKGNIYFVILVYARQDSENRGNGQFQPRVLVKASIKGQLGKLSSQGWSRDYLLLNPPNATVDQIFTICVWGSSYCHMGFSNRYLASPIGSGYQGKKLQCLCKLLLDVILLYFSICREIACWRLFSTDVHAARTQIPQGRDYWTMWEATYKR